ncbi:MAG: aldose 1-epimerase family protein [Deinococcota bacterium]
MINLFGKLWTAQALREHIGDMSQLAGVQALVLDDGRGRGSRVLNVHTGSGLEFQVLVDRALDVGMCRYNGQSLCWHSPAGWPHPAFAEHAGLGWLRSFGGGLVTTCGLDQFGAANRDGEKELGIHGRVSNLPAEQVSWSADWETTEAGEDYVITIQGKVRQARLFGENLLLCRTLRTALGASWLELTDAVTNEGFNPQPHMILYHCNLGFPLIAEGSHLDLEATTTTARDAVAEAGIDNWQHIHAPQQGYDEQVFHHAVEPSDNHYAQATVHSPMAGFGVRLEYSLDSLPDLYQWKMLGQGAYVLGLEPANCAGIRGRADARERGELVTLEPSETRRYQLRFSII